MTETAIMTLGTQLTPNGEAVEVFAGHLPLGLLCGMIDFDRHSAENPTGYQRPMIRDHVESIREFLTQEWGICVDAIVLNDRDGRFTRFRPLPVKNGSGSVVEVVFEAGTKLQVPIGQHRTLGALSAITRDKKHQDRLARQPHPVLLTRLDKDHEGLVFDLADRQRAIRATHRNVRRLARYDETERLGADIPPRVRREELLHGLSVKVATHILSDDPRSPFFGRPPMAGTPTVHSLAFALRDSGALQQVVFSGQSDKAIIDFYINLWRAAHDEWESAFDKIDGYFLSAAPGASLITMISGSVALIARDRRWSYKAIRAALRQLKLTQKKWSRRSTDNLYGGDNVGQSYAALRPIANDLIARLKPRTV